MKKLIYVHGYNDQGSFALAIIEYRLIFNLFKCVIILCGKRQAGGAYHTVIMYTGLYEILYRYLLVLICFKQSSELTRERWGFCVLFIKTSTPWGRVYEIRQPPVFVFRCSPTFQSRVGAAETSARRALVFGGYKHRRQPVTTHICSSPQWLWVASDCHFLMHLKQKDMIPCQGQAPTFFWRSILIVGGYIRTQNRCGSSRICPSPKLVTIDIQ